jgi:hypothetical protein
MARGTCPSSSNGEGFQSKCRERRETADEAHRNHDAVLFANQDAAGERSCKKPDEKAPEDIDDECAQGKRLGSFSLHPTTEEIACEGAGAASQENEKKFCHRRSLASLGATRTNPFRGLVGLVQCRV